MIDLSGVARHLRLSVDQLRVVADLFQQGYQPGFIERYRADETGNLPRESLWLLKLEIDRQLRLQAARDKASSQLPKDAELDAEGLKYLERATTEVEIEVTLRAFRSRRQLSQNQESDKQSSQLLEKMIEYQGPPIADLTAWASEQLAIEASEAEIALQHAARLVGMLMQSDSGLNENLRRTIQRRAQVRVELCDPSHAEAADAAADARDLSTGGNSTSDHADSEPDPGDFSPTDTEDFTSDLEPLVVDCNQPLAPLDHANQAVIALETESIDTIAVAAAAENATNIELNDRSATQVTFEAATGIVTEVVSAVPQQGAAQLAEQSVTETIVVGELGSEATVVESEKKVFAAFNKKKEAKPKASKPSKKPVAKMTPRQRRRRWLIAMLQPMKSLKCPLTKLSSYQHLMLGRGRRSQLVKTELQYDRQALVALARDTFVTDKHPLAKWFSNAAQEALEHSLLAKSEADAVNDLEEIASQRLLEHSVDQLRQSLMQRPVRGHCILVIDSVGPKAAAVSIVDPFGQVLAIDEIPVSASPSVVTQNVTRLGELVHQHRVTLVALTNGPARRFLVLSLRELINQSTTSGLRWTMADRGGADAYAVSRSALKELSIHNRRHRAAIWVGRSLQDPLNELLKVDVNRLRLGSFQRELPQEPLKKLVREVISDCVYQNGIDARKASVEQLGYVPGVYPNQAQQIFALSAAGTLTSRKELLNKTSGWSEMDSRQAIPVLRVFGSEQPLDATTIHPDDYRLAERLIENTELNMPPSEPEGWNPPQVAQVVGSKESAPMESENSTGSDIQAPSADGITAPVEPVSDEPTPSGDSVSATLETNNSSVDQAASEDASAAGTLLVDGGGSPAVTQVENATAPAPSEVSAPLTWPAAKPSSSGPAWPKPEFPEEIGNEPTTLPTVDVEKLARSWQVGREKLRQVASCLHNPFADSRLSRPPVPLMTEMPTLSNLQPGMCVWAVVIGVADFGAFVELAPDCSGLIHISRLSANYIEDPHQCVQVGDLVMTWVVSVDEKKNRVALTALSPVERAAAEAAAAARKSEQEEHRRRDRGAHGTTSGPRPTNVQSPAAGHARTGQTSGGTGQPRSGTEQTRTGSADGRRSGGQSSGGRGRGNQHSQARGKGGPPHTKSVVVTSKKPKANITEAMKDGEEPLRSFSDLMQFYQAKRTDDKTPPPPKTPDAPPTDES